MHTWPVPCGVKFILSSWSGNTSPPEQCFASDSCFCADLSHGFCTAQTMKGHYAMITKSESERLVVNDALEITVEKL